MPKVAAVMETYQIPTWVWKPILMLESGGNPLAQAKTAREDSRGLFQINVRAHPEYAGLDLFDPVVNATIAARDFLAPAYRRVAGIPNPEFQAEYVWHYGIRPAWTAEKGEKIRRLAQLYASVSPPASGEPLPAGGSPPSLWQRIHDMLYPGESLPSAPGGEDELAGLPWYERLQANLLYGVVFIVLSAVGLLALYLALRPEMDEIVKKVVR